MAWLAGVGWAIVLLVVLKVAVWYRESLAVLMVCWTDRETGV